MKINHKWSNGLAHEPCHVNLHALWAEWVINSCSTILELGVGVLSDNLVFHAHKLWNSLFHPVLDHVYLDLNLIENANKPK